MGWEAMSEAPETCFGCEWPIINCTCHLAGLAEDDGLPSNELAFTQAQVEAAVKRALYATRDMSWSGVEAIISDPDAIAKIVSGK
jgi:hypothetical protein